MVSATFDPENPKYKCCFGKIHVKTATKWIFYYEFILSLLFAGFFAFIDPEFSWAIFSILFSLDVFIFASGIYAVKKEESSWLIPYYFGYVFAILSIVSYNGIHLYYKVFDFDWIFYCDIYYLVTSTCFSIVIFRCYQYFNENKESAALPISFSNINNENVSCIPTERF